VGLAIDGMLKHHRRLKKYEALDILADFLNNPGSYREDAALGLAAGELLDEPEERDFEVHDLGASMDFEIYGANGIQPGAIHQMHTAIKLPVAKAGALMPDAHVGYGLPIGGVLATENAVIPYGVGVDIGCRMMLSVFPLPVTMIDGQRHRLVNLLQENSRFGLATFKDPMDDEVLEREEFKTIPVAKEHHGRARKQIGSSGGGNHFVEFGEVTVDDTNTLGLEPGSYLALLTHSGSRGLGAMIAKHYTKLAMHKTRLPQEARHLAWLSLDTEEGMEYWLAMNLAGDYASACHRHIHHRMSKSLGDKAICVVENHHNFAWKEKQPDGTELIVHRKGATPAAKDELGVIPGSMTAPGFVVRGKGAVSSLSSASHGAGRVMSRRQAKETVSGSQLKQHLRDMGVTLIGGGLDEAPMAYKDINSVMAAQKDLVSIEARFQPRVVRMAGD
jgi:tRNA-splicing ligase RtcB